MRNTIITPSLALCCALLGGLALVQTGCSVLEPKADNTKLYVLRAHPGTSDVTADNKQPKPIVRVGPGKVAPYLEVTPIIVQDGPNAVKQLQNHHWAEPLSKGISRALAENLSQRLNGAQTIIYPEPAHEATVEVRYAINRLEGTLDGAVSLQVTWQVVELPSGKVLQAGNTDRVIAAAQRTGDVSAYVARIAESIGVLADEVAAAIHSSNTH